MDGLFRLREEQLERIKPFFPKSRGVSRVDDRKVLSGIIYVLRSGLRSRECPSRLWTLENPHQPLPPLVGKGVFQLILSELARSAGTEAEADTAPETGVEPEEVLMIDATCVKAHRTACSLKKGAPTPRWMGRTKGGLTSKRPVVCGGKGRPVRLLLSEGPCSDFTGAEVLLQDLPEANVLIGDKGYDSNKMRAMVLEQGMTPCIPSRRNRNKRLPSARGCRRSAIRWRTCWHG